MSIAGRCIARSTSSGIVVGPGMARNSRPARTVIVGFPCWAASQGGTAMDAADWPEFQPAAQLFSHCVGDRMPDLILDLGRRRTRNCHRRAVALLAGFD